MSEDAAPQQVRTSLCPTARCAVTHCTLYTDMKTPSRKCCCQLGGCTFYTQAAASQRGTSCCEWLTINAVTVLFLPPCHAIVTPFLCLSLAGLLPALRCLQDLLQLQGSVGPLTNLASLAELHPDLAFQEYMRRQNSAFDNIHTPLKAKQQAKRAETESSHGVRHPNHHVLQCVSCFVVACFVLACTVL